MLSETASAEVLPNDPAGILATCREQFLLLIGDNVRPAVRVKIGHRERMQRPVREALWEFVLDPAATFPIRVFKYCNLRVLDVSVSDNNFEFAIAIQISDRGAYTNAKRSLPPHWDVLVRDPFAAFAVFVFEPGIGT